MLSVSCVLIRTVELTLPVFKNSQLLIVLCLAVFYLLMHKYRAAFFEAIFFSLLGLPPCICCVNLCSSRHVKTISPGAWRLSAHQQTGRSARRVPKHTSITVAPPVWVSYITLLSYPHLLFILSPPLSINPSPSRGPVKKKKNGKKSHRVTETALSQTGCRAGLKEPLSLSLFLFGVTRAAGAGLV